MTGPFPERITVPLGLRRPRLVWGMKTFTVMLLAFLLVGPLILIGRQAVWGAPLILLAGVWLAYESRRDPDFLRTWSGELRFKKRYR